MKNRVIGRLQALVNSYLLRFPHLHRLVRLYLRGRRAKTNGYPRWTQMLGKDYASYKAHLGAVGSGPRVLIATSVGGHLAGTSLESLLGAALTVRGAQVDVLLCDAALPACLHCDVTWYPRQEQFVKHGPSKDLCHHCFEPAAAMYTELGLPVLRYSEFLDAKTRAAAAERAARTSKAEIDAFKLDDVAVGEHAVAGALRYYARASLDSEPWGEAVLRRYFHAALLTTYATQRLLAARRYDAAVFHHGIYVPQGLIGEVCRAHGVRVVNWNPAYRKRTFIFSHHDTYHHTLLSEPTGVWDDLALTPERERELLTYLKSRWYGTEDWIWFHEKPQPDLKKIAQEIGIDWSRPCIGLLTNVMWDAQLHYPANAFASMLDWVTQTIRYFAGRPSLQLLIRVHPAEIRGTLPSRQPLVAELARLLPTMPPNVFVIPPESSVSTYAAMHQCNAVLIYGTKTGVELTSMGIPVIVAGEAWIRNKGLTLDARSAGEYFALLDRLPLDHRMSAGTIDRARRYAYHFFFRRMIPVDCMEPTGGNPPYRVHVRGVRDLLPGTQAGLDVICDGILKGTEFVYPAEHA